MEYLKIRHSGIGGSDSSAIIGMNPYKSNIDLFKEKTGKKEIADISDKPYVRYGTLAEDLLRQLFALDHEEEFEVNHLENSMYRDKEYPFLFASLDGELLEKETGRKGILEIKTTNILQSMQKEKWKEKIPDNYYTQILHYLMVTGADFVVLVAQLKSEFNGTIYKQTKEYKIERTEVEEDLKYLKEQEIKFWTENVLKDKEPNLLLPDI